MERFLEDDKHGKDTGSWVTHSCFFACGGRCVNRSFVCDGKVLFQDTDSLHADSPDFPQQRGCARGRSLRHAIFSKDRLTHPLKRKHWSVGGGKKELRGRDEWEEISWDEALDIVASEVTRIKETYGNKSILALGYEYLNVIPGLYTAPSLNAFGGCTTTWGQASQGAFPLVSNSMKGSYNLGALDFSDRYEIRKAKLIIMWGQNPAWSQAGNPLFHYLQAKKAGARFIFIDSWFNPSMQVLADEWIPVRPGTDTALLLGIAYWMIAHDSYDQAFLDSHCIGFDAEHMPKGADPQDNFKDYVLGTYDGVSKNPAWASSICGVPKQRIEALAKEMASSKPMTMRASQAPARSDNGATFVQAFYTVGWMTGNVGFPGAEVSAGGSAGNMVFGGEPLVRPGSKGYTWPENPLCQPPRGGGMLARGEYDPDLFYGIAMPEVWDAVVSGKYHDFVHGVQPIDIRMLWKIGDGGRMNQNPNFMQAVKAYQSVEFVVTSDLWMTNDARYADIVLPASSFWERDAQILTQINRETLIFAQKVCDPPGEAKEDLWIEAELAKRWGINPSLVQPLSTKQMAFNELLGAEVILPDGSGWEPLVSVTDDDLKELGVEGVPHEGRIPLREFLETGVYQVPRHEDDGLGHVAYADFVKDPTRFPVQTSSGKFEIYCSNLVRRFKDFGLSDIAPIAKYVPARDGFESASGKYPLQCISVHAPSRSHQLFDNIAQLRELFPHDVWINPLDAKRSGITHGETVHVSSAYGQILRRAKVTRLVMPGVVIIGQGAWASINDKGIDEGGNANTLQGSKLAGEGHCTWNTSLVRVDPWAGEPLQLDYKRVSDSMNQETKASSSLKMHAFTQEKLLQDSLGQNGALRENQTTKVNNDHGSLGFFFNANECSGCKACVAACKDNHNLPVGKKFRKVVTFEAGEWQISSKDHAHSTELSFIAESDESVDLPSISHLGRGAYADTLIENKGVFSFSLSISCNHCDEPACLAACPRGAISKDPQTGIVSIDEDACIGCGKCAKACPYDAPVVFKDLHKTFKCDLCKDRLQAGLEPACVAACNMRCLHVFPKNYLVGSFSETNGVVSEDMLALFPSTRSDNHGSAKQSSDSNCFVMPHRFVGGLDKSQISLLSMIEEFKNE